MKIIKILSLVVILNLLKGSVGNDLLLLSFNIHGFRGKMNYEKITKIIKNINKYDIILLQENWSYKELFLNELSNFNFIFGENKIKSIKPSGLSIALNKEIEIIRYEDNIFKRCNGFLFHGNDCFASKGFLFLEINMNGKKLNIYNLHLDAGNSRKDKQVRKSQLKEISDHVSIIDAHHPLIISGDFNINFNGQEKNEILEFLKNFNLKFIKWDKKYFLDNKIDYILYRNLQNLKISNLANILYDLSDHPPMETSFTFK